MLFGAALIAGLIYSKKKHYAEGEMLNAVDNYIKPSLDLHPVFFEKKSDKKTDAAENSEATDEKEEESKPENEVEEAEREENENGTDN